MQRASVETIVQSLNEGGIRYLIVGGLAVVAHGYVRFTADLDLFIDLEPSNARRAIAVLGRLGYRPRAPVRFEDFADSVARAEWTREKGLTVFSLFSEQHARTEIDLFVEAPLDFEQAYRSARRMEVRPGLEATFVGYDDLVRMKRASGRPHDLEDIAQMEARRNPPRADAT
jgi:hypothetical protein